MTTRVLKCECGRCQTCRNRAWMRAHRPPPRPRAYECKCGRANVSGTCERCWTSNDRNGEVRPPRRAIYWFTREMKWLRRRREELTIAITQIDARNRGER